MYTNQKFSNVHKLNYLVMALLVTIGVGVGAVSLYMASLSGVMRKMGLVGGDFSQSVDTNELARQMMFQKKDTECGIWQNAVPVPRYLFSKGEERVRYAGELGGERIICGVRLVQRGNVERGVYTIVKGLYYLRSHYSEMRNLIQNNRDKCSLLQSPDYERWVEGYLNATEGRVHELVLDVYKQVQIGRAGIEELCSE